MLTSMLHQIGVDVRVYEQAWRFARIGAGMQVLPNSMKVLRGIVWQPLGEHRWPQDGRYRLACSVCGWVKRDVERQGRAVRTVT
jgi:2-polyprenyl-6-methoxyphenol hydroxylase-like FAD-dependent oxidoreductase